jgi:hypothetical protein
MGTGTETLVAQKKLSLAEIAPRAATGAAALLVLVLLLMPWYEARYEPKISGLDVSDFGGEAAKPITAKAWDASLVGKLVVALAVAALVIAAINLLAPRVSLPIRPPVALVVLGGTAAALVALGMLTDPQFAPEPETFTGIPELDAVQFVYHAETRIGIYVSLAAATAIALAGAVCWAGSRDLNLPPRPPAPPPPPPRL